MNIVLASNSPRRKQLLEKAGFKIIVDPSHADERSIKDKDLKKMILKISELKAKTVAKRHKNSIIVAADTMVNFCNKDIGQPANKDDARKMLKELRGKMHEVWTGLTLINTKTGKMLQGFDISKVTLKNISDKDIELYLDSGLYKGKAGAYNINDPEFENFIKKYEGSYENIMGLPIEKTSEMMAKIKG